MRRKERSLMALRNNITEKLDKVKSLDEKLEAFLIKESGNTYEVETNEILEYHENFYELSTSTIHCPHRQYIEVEGRTDSKL